MSSRITRWWLPAALLVATLAMTPGLLERVSIETRGDVYEIAVPAIEVDALVKQLSADEVYGRMADAGVASIALEMLTVEDLELAGRVSILGRAELISLLVFAGLDPGILPDGSDGEFLALLDGDGLADAIERGRPPGTVDRFEIQGQTMLHIRGVANVADVVVGYDTDLARDIAGRGFGLIARVPDTVDADPDVTADAIAELHDELGVDRVLFTGSRAPYIDEPEALGRFADRLRADSFSVMLIELLEQEGTTAYYDLVGSGIRLHSLEMEQVGSTSVAVDRAVRAIVERNIRSIFIRPEPISAEGRLDQVTEIAAGVRDRLAGDMEPGPSRPFDTLDASPLLRVGAVVASVALAVAFGLLVAPWLGILAGFGTLALAAGWFAGIDIAGDLLRLGIAFVASVVAVFVARPRARLGPATVQYLGAAAVVIVGGLTITALGYEDRFLVGAKDFFGVKALLVAPLAVTGAWAAWRSLDNPGFRDAPRVARMPIELWQIVALGIAGGALFYLLIRSGNTGAAASWELQLRQWLEDVLLVRPRTKEFLIGFPALIVGILLTARTRHGWWLYAVGSIGTASAIDTFAHFHTPLLISLLRTAYAIGFGYVIGVVGLGLALWAWPRSRDFVLSRWR